MRIEIKNRDNLKDIKDKYGFNTYSQTLEHIIVNYELLYKNNNRLSNENMILRLSSKL